MQKDSKGNEINFNTPWSPDFFTYYGEALGMSGQEIEQERAQARRALRRRQTGTTYMGRAYDGVFAKGKKYNEEG